MPLPKNREPTANDHQETVSLTPRRDAGGHTARCGVRGPRSKSTADALLVCRQIRSASALLTGADRVRYGVWVKECMATQGFAFDFNLVKGTTVIAEIGDRMANDSAAYRAGETAK